jgi:hypothetical protein
MIAREIVMETERKLLQKYCKCDFHETYNEINCKCDYGCLQLCEHSDFNGAMYSQHIIDTARENMIDNQNKSWFNYFW